MSTDPAAVVEEAPAPPAAHPAVERLVAEFPGGEEVVTADAIPTVRVAPEQVAEAAGLLRGELGFGRFIDLTAVDYPEREDRFEVNYVFYSMAELRWFRLKARTAEAVPSITGHFAGANWYEREAYDLFGVRFDGHPNLTRLMLPDDWEGHPLRRDVPTQVEPVDFVVTREIYGT